MDDLISRQAAIEALEEPPKVPDTWSDESAIGEREQWEKDVKALNSLPSIQPTLHGYNIEHLELIARVLQKENLPPERIVEALTDIGRIVAIAQDEFEEALRKAVEQCMNCGSPMEVAK